MRIQSRRNEAVQGGAEDSNRVHVWKGSSDQPNFGTLGDNPVCQNSPRRIVGPGLLPRVNTMTR